MESRASRPDVRETRLAQQAACDKVASLAPVVQQEQRADLGEEPAIALLTRQNTGRISAAFAGFPTLIPHWRPGILRPSRPRRSPSTSRSQSLSWLQLAKMRSPLPDH